MSIAMNFQAISPEHIDQRVYLHHIDWQSYEALLAMRGEQSGARVTYLKGEVELMAPSLNHELFKKTLARLLEAYAEECGIELSGYGSWTVKSAEKERGFEADECYVVGVRDGPPTIPDIAIEIVWTSGGIDKLEVYRGLGIPEVWFWKKGALQFFLLENDAYRIADRSRLLPDLDPALIARFMNEPSQTQAVRAFRVALREIIGATDG